jgi:hypothetical protein
MREVDDRFFGPSRGLASDCRTKKLPNSRLQIAQRNTYRPGLRWD